jgi:cytochrome oxidase Cu insertion factor (SCO1/SenC/PrrC family)
MNTPFGIAAALVIGAASIAGAQQSTPADSTAAAIPAVGEMAPDFSFRAIDREGIAANPTRLSALRGQTVVLWFFVRARTRG